MSAIGTMTIFTRPVSVLRHNRQCVGYWMYVNCRKLHRKIPKTWKTWNALGGQGNIVLMGNPGSGKTTTGTLVGEALDRPVVDIDNHHLVPWWGMTVAEKLKQIGDKRFLEEEGRALLGLQVKKSIISLSGSNPLHIDAMAKAARTGVVIYLDATVDTILERLKTMKVDHIVGMEHGASLQSIVESRRKFYEKWHDIRIMVHATDTREEVAQRVLKAVNEFENNPGFQSTRATQPTGKYVSFLDTVLQGLAPDGGLYVKATNRPKMSLDDLNRLVPLDFKERAVRLMEAWIHPLDICPQELRSYMYKSYTDGLFEHPDLAPLYHLRGNQFIQELFHGPTGSFKDGALQLMPRFFTKAMKQVGPDEKYLIVVATSGDTGIATLDGFSRHASDANVGVVVLYPKQTASKVQIHQLTTMEGFNVKVIGVDGSFDYCQQMVKRMFRDEKVKQALGESNLSAANSINWGRLLPQILYHATAYLNLVRDGHISMGDPVDICIPTGNFGNLLSAYYVKEMGFPLRKLICASNSNNILTTFLRTGVYNISGRRLKKTGSPSIDIIESSNLERLLFHLSEEDPGMVSAFYKDLAESGRAEVTPEVLKALQENFDAEFAKEENTNEALLEVFKDTGYLMDPHTAVAQYVATNIGDPNTTTVIAGTAHYARFIDNILPVIEPTVNISDLDVGQLLEKAVRVSSKPAMHRLLSSMVWKRVVHRDTVAGHYHMICEKVVEFARTL